jgi:hypothetical protein
MGNSQLGACREIEANSISSLFDRLRMGKIAPHAKDQGAMIAP